MNTKIMILIQIAVTGTEFLTRRIHLLGVRTRSINVFEFFKSRNGILEGM